MGEGAEIVREIVREIVHTISHTISLIISSFLKMTFIGFKMFFDDLVSGNSIGVYNSQTISATLSLSVQTGFIPAWVVRNAGNYNCLHLGTL